MKTWNAIARTRCVKCEKFIEPGELIARYAPHPLNARYQHPQCASLPLSDEAIRFGVRPK